jgi:DNA topoisomerase III
VSRRGAASEAEAAPARAASPKPAAATDPLALGCPRCGAGTLITGQRGWGCSRWREGCAFVIWFQTFGRQVTAAQLRDLIQRGKTRKARFFTPAGVEIDGRLILEPATNNGAVRLEPAS